MTALELPLKRTCGDLDLDALSAAARSSVRPQLATSGELNTQLGTTRRSQARREPGDGVLGGDRALVVGPVREQRRAGDVAGREHAVDGGAQGLVGDHEAVRVELDAGLLVAQAGAQRPAADGDEHARRPSSSRAAGEA